MILQYFSEQPSAPYDRSKSGFTLAEVCLLNLQKAVNGTYILSEHAIPNCY